MNRSNVGNVVTNATQIISTAGFTAARSFGKGQAHKTLNNSTSNNVDDIMAQSGQKPSGGGVTSSNNNIVQTETEEQEIVTPVVREVNSPQMSDIKKKMDNDANFIKKWNRDSKGRFAKKETNANEGVGE